MAMNQPNLENEKVIEVEDLVVTFEVRGKKGKKTIIPVDHVSFSIRKGEVLSLVGESGSGKSTIGRTLVGINRPSGGRIRVNGQDVTNISRKSLKEYRKNVQMVFQDP